jgi:SNF2 family DNA or RNA helicase
LQDIFEKKREKFQDDINCKVMLATSQKAGTGFTLTAASYAIFLDVPWTAAETIQCEDRIHRIGSSKPVFIYRLITKDTIDEKVEEIINVKEAMSDYIIDNNVSDNTIKYLKQYIADLK